MLNEPHVFILQARDLSPFIVQVIENIKAVMKKDLSNRDHFEVLMNYVIKDIIPKIEQ